ncbi:pseudouridine synthase [Limihaloglobus sulfuriphilus]|uniref:pseudouridine synthase n=1 Tax=Limihaloglobus sulfuriphilus TaxID=1851148 RepID=UPI001649C176|nr:pseudouridine synthase [Limihaloglobus sulfuriphilus]
MAKLRLQKILANSGIDSRRNCEELIRDGKVRVNRRVVHELPAFADPDTDVITVHGKRIESTAKVYFLLNKPRGVICTNKDPHGRKKAVDFVPCSQRIFCVGRLDADTTGAIILTNDSELVNRLTHPKYKIAKTYEVVLKGRLDTKAIEKIQKGVWLSDGKTEPAKIRFIKRGPDENVLEVTITQGMNRQVRRIFSRFGLKVKRLKRTQIGSLTLKGVGPGNFKPLTKKQINYLIKPLVKRKPAVKKSSVKKEN